MNNKKCYGPFQLWVLNNFPFTIDDWDSITQYQMLCKCLGALKEQLDVNSDIYKKIQDIENYLANLDLQDEVDHKIDEMAENGQLQEIITEYLQINGVLAFNTVSDMVSATNVINGTTCKTLGYYEVNDGGSSLYKIRNVTNEDIIDNGSIIALNNNTLVAELIIDKVLNVKQFGVIGDGSVDESAKIQSAIDFLDRTYDRSTLLLNNNDKYLLASGIELPVYISLAVEGSATITYSGNDFAITIVNGNRQYGDNIKGQLNDVNSLMLYGDLVIESSVHETTVNSTSFENGGILVKSYDENKNLILHDYDINNVSFMFLTIGVYLKSIHLFAVGVNNCKFNYCNIARLYGVESGEETTDAGERMYMNNCFVYNVGIANVYKDGSPSSDVIRNCSFDRVSTVLYHDKTLMTVTFDGCHFEGLGNLSLPAMNDYITANFGNAKQHLIYNNFNNTYQTGCIKICNSNLHIKSWQINGKFACDSVLNNYLPSVISNARLNTIIFNNNFVDCNNTGNPFVLANNGSYDVKIYNDSSYNPYYSYMIPYNDSIMNFADTVTTFADDWFSKRGIDWGNLSGDLTVETAPTNNFGITKLIKLWTSGNYRTIKKTKKVTCSGVNAFIIFKLDNLSNINNMQFNVTFTDSNGLSTTKYVGANVKTSLGNNMYLLQVEASANVTSEYEVEVLLYANTTGDHVYLGGMGIVPYM
ncbi:MAG: hypothetical protein IIZ67_04015 [Bacilli bacterium]|nr:hypothetical protein [Bacilli bacterium]